MAHDLGAEQGDVHAAAQAVLDFWFALPPEQHFAVVPELDARIAARFGALRERVLASGAAEWTGEPDTLLAAIVLLDQFSRNIHRNSAQAFAADPVALHLARTAIARGWDAGIAPERRPFVYLPLMHAEDLAIQQLSVDKFAALGRAENLDFAVRHRDVIARFGRFPSRNAALGRASTPAELAFLASEGAGW